MNSIMPIPEIKWVKNSFVIRNTDEQHDNVKVFHYNSCILDLNLITRKVVKSYTPTRTSSKMANRVKAYYDIY